MIGLASRITFDSVDEKYEDSYNRTSLTINYSTAGTNIRSMAGPKHG